MEPSAAVINPGVALPIEYRLVPVVDPEGNYREAAQKWAEPDIQHAAQSLRQIASDTRARQRIGRAASQAVLTKFSRKAVAETICDRLAECGIKPTLDGRQDQGSD